MRFVRVRNSGYRSVSEGRNPTKVIDVTDEISFGNILPNATVALRIFAI
jgi:hypothetical protein